MKIQNKNLEYIILLIKDRFSLMYPSIDYKIEYINADFYNDDVSDIANIIYSSKRLNNFTYKEFINLSIFCEEFINKKGINRNIFTKEEANNIIDYGIKQFSYSDRNLLESEKFYNLFLFIFDYAMLCFKDGHINNIISTKKVSILIDNVKYQIPINKKNNILNYFNNKNNETPVELYDNLYIAAMIIDLFQSFFTIIGIKRRGNNKFINEEKNLIGDLLIMCKLINNVDKGKLTTYITTINSKYGDYYKKNKMNQWRLKEYNTICFIKQKKSV
jgi:hypothetical protein